MNPNTDTILLTVQEVAILLQLSVLTIYKYIKAQKLEAVEFGGHYRIQKSSLEKFINSHKVKKITNNSYGKRN